MEGDIQDEVERDIFNHARSLIDRDDHDHNLEVQKWASQEITAHREEKEAQAASGANTASDGVTITGEEDVQCGDYGEFKNQKNPAKNNLERDHIPSQAAIKKVAEDLLNGDKLTTCIINRLKNWSKTLALPKDFHKTGRTHGSKNATAQIEQDSQDLGEAAKKDAEAYEEQLDDADINAECKGKIKKALEEIKELTDDYLVDFIQEQIDHCTSK